jgi:hypothetical protein
MAKQFMSRINWWFITNVRRANMVTIEIGYKKIVLPRDKAMMLMECLESSMEYQAKYWSDEKRRELGMTECYTYHVFPNDTQYSMSLISDEHFQMAKLAGKPQE